MNAQFDVILKSALIQSVLDEYVDSFGKNDILPPEACRRHEERPDGDSVTAGDGEPRRTNPTGIPDSSCCKRCSREDMQAGEGEHNHRHFHDDAKEQNDI